MKKLLSSLIGIAAFVGLSAQCSVVEVPLVQRVSASTVIVEGKVTGQYSYWNSNHSMIYTANTIELYKIFKGSIAGGSIEIITEGGTVDMDRITVEPTLELKVGDVGMFTCIPPTRVKNNIASRQSMPQFEAYASLQGFVKYDEITNTASDVFRTYNDLQTEVYNVCGPVGGHQYTVVKTRPDNSTQRIGDQLLAPLSISNFSPGTLTAGTGTQLTINGSGFGAVQGSSVVRFRNADDGGATTVSPLASQYISWSTSQIVVEVPSDAGTGTIQVFNGSATATSASSLTISYAHLNVNFDPGSGTIAYQTDHINDNGTGGYTWRMNTGFDADAPARASFMRAFDSWRCATNVNWSIGATTSINDAVSDGTNIICYDNTAPLSSGILGVCYSYWSGCANGPTIVWYVNELDIIFDEGSNITPLTWEFGPTTPSGSEYDFETVAVHELGHGHQLGHVIAPGAIMHYAISNGTSNRSLGSNDLAGGQFVQAKSVVANVCGPGGMSSMSCSTPPVANFSGSPTTVCAGASVSFTDLSTGTPTSWSWTFTGGSPGASTAQNPTVTYNTPGVYAVSLTATNVSGSDPVTMNGYITVNGLPSVNFSATPSQTVCAGQSVTLSGSGAVSYSWTGGVSNGVPFSAVSTQSYTVTGTNGNGCTATAVAPITVNASPTMTIASNPANGIVCTGNQATLTATGNAVSYAWTGGVTNNVAFTPTVTTTYTVTGTGSNGCTATGQRTLTVQSCSAVPSTQLTSAYCGATNLNLQQWLYNTPVAGAQDYQYQFTDIATSATFNRVKGNNQPNMPLSYVAVQYGHSYYVQVRAKVNNTWGTYGTLTQCSVAMAATPPATTLMPTTCGASGMTHTSKLYCQGMAGATAYWWTIQRPSPSYYQGHSSTIANISLGQWTGLLANATYTVTVQYQAAGVWSTPSPVCTITMGAVVRLMGPDGMEMEEDNSADFNFGISMYPNPIGNGVNPTLNITGADQQNAVVTVMDLTGRTVATYNLFVEGDSYSAELAEFPELVAGMYIMQVQVGDKVQSQKFIAE